METDGFVGSERHGLQMSPTQEPLSGFVCLTSEPTATLFTGPLLPVVLPLREIGSLSLSSSSDPSSGPGVVSPYTTLGPTKTKQGSLASQHDTVHPRGPRRVLRLPGPSNGDSQTGQGRPVTLGSPHFGAIRGVVFHCIGVPSSSYPTSGRLNLNLGSMVVTPESV